MGVTNLQVGDYIENVESRQKFEIIEYQWSFCSICTQLPFMVWCAKSKDKSSAHYRFYRIKNVRTGQEHEVDGAYMDKAQFRRKIIQVNK